MMKQLNRSDEAIEAIKSFRHLSPTDSQESIDNILIELYKVNLILKLWFHFGVLALPHGAEGHINCFRDRVESKRK